MLSWAMPLPIQTHSMRCTAFKRQKSLHIKTHLSQLEMCREPEVLQGRAVGSASITIFLVHRWGHVSCCGAGTRHSTLQLAAGSHAASSLQWHPVPSGEMPRPCRTGCGIGCPFSPFPARILRSNLIPRLLGWLVTGTALHCPPPSHLQGNNSNAWGRHSNCGLPTMQLCADQTYLAAFPV